MHKVIIDEREVKLSKIPAREGWEVLHTLGRVLGPALAEMAQENVTGALDYFFKNSTPEEVYFFIEKMAPKIIVDNDKLKLDEYGFVIKCVKALLEFNFEDFFSPLVDALNS